MWSIVPKLSEWTFENVSTIIEYGCLSPNWEHKSDFIYINSLSISAKSNSFSSLVFANFVYFYKFGISRGINNPIKYFVFLRI